MGDRERLAQLEELYALRQKAAGANAAPEPSKRETLEAAFKARREGKAGALDNFEAAPRDTTAYDPNEGVGSRVFRAAKNLPGSAARTADAVLGTPFEAVRAVAHPAQTIKGIASTADQAADILAGGVNRNFGDNTRDNSKYNDFANANYEKYGTVGRVGHTLAADPFVPVAAAATLGRTALRGVRRAGAIPHDTPLPDPVPVAVRAPPAPTVAELKTQSRGLYDQASKAGVVIDQNAFKQFATKIKDEMRTEGIDKDLHPKSTAALNRIINTTDDVELNDLEILRKIAGDASETLDRSDKRIARRIIDGIDDFAQNLQPHQVKAGNAADAVSLLSDARKTWRASARGEAIEKAIEKAKLSGGALKTTLDEAYRREFKKLYNNERGISRFTAAQKEAIRKVAYGEGKVQSVLNTVGKIIPTGKMSFLSTGAVGAGAHLLGLPVTGPILATGGVAGLGGKIASARITSRNARRASELARTK